MNLSIQAIQEFKKIYWDLFKIEISDQEAQEKGKDFLLFFKLIFQSKDRKKFHDK